jgi:hypothetical protein
MHRSLGVVFSLPAAADDTSLKFKGGIGVIPVSSVTCVPSATPCVTGPTVTVDSDSESECSSRPATRRPDLGDRRSAQVSANGSITVHGKGLVLGGGNGAGGVPAGLNVFAP